MREIFKQNGSFLLLFMMVIFCNTINAQNDENSGGFNWDGMNDLDNVNIPPNSKSDDSWDHASLYWNMEPDDHYNDSTNMGDGYIPPPKPIIKKDEREPKKEDYEIIDQHGDRLTKSEVVLTKKVKPGETHTQSVKVLRDISNSAEKKVIDLIVNGVKVGTVTFSAPLRDANGVDIYSKMTVQVFNYCPVAITSITFDSPETSTYEGSPHSTNGNLDNALTDLSLYRDLGIVNFTAPINDNEDIIFTGSIAAASYSQANIKDPCIVAKELTTLGTNPVFQKALQDIRNAPDFYNREYSISLGKNSSGQIISTDMKPGDKIGVEVNYSVQGFFLNLHNHPSHTIHSGKDLYNMVFFNKLYPNYTGSIVLPNKDEVYTAVVTDLAAAQVFAARYLTDPKTKESAHYPDFMYTEMTQVLGDMHSYSIESESRAKAFVVSKYNAGITFFRQNNNGNFYPLILKETKQANGSKTYALIPCN